MSDKTIAQKLLIKEGKQVLLINAPKGYKAVLGVLPAGAKLVRRPPCPSMWSNCLLQIGRQWKQNCQS